MPVIAERDREMLRNRLAESLVNDVSITMFAESLARSLLTIPGQPMNPMAQAARSLAEELADLSPKINLQILDIHGDGAELARTLKVDRIPAYVLGDDPEGRLRFYGTPVGNEFATLLETIEDLSTGTAHINSAVAKTAREVISQPVQVQVFVTPT